MDLLLIYADYHLRDLFPVDCYGETQYNTEKGVIPYNEFARGIAQEDGSSNPSFGHTFRVIMRNKSAKVDAFLDTLVSSSISRTSEQFN